MHCPHSLLAEAGKAVGRKAAGDLSISASPYLFMQECRRAGRFLRVGRMCVHIHQHTHPATPSPAPHSLCFHMYGTCTATSHIVSHACTCACMHRLSPTEPHPHPYLLMCLQLQLAAIISHHRPRPGVRGLSNQISTDRSSPSP